MKTPLIAYFSTLLVILVMDAIWLGVVMPAQYRAWIGGLMLDTPRWVPAVLFYLLYAVGVTVFAALPGVREGSWTTALMYGALLGLVAYGTYDLSNFATLKAWPMQLVVVDMIWGAFITAAAATVAFFTVKWWA